MEVEINKKFVEADTKIKAGNATLMITPPLNEDYWVFRVKLHKDQAILAFPKFSGLGIGFAQEEDWNTNLPYHCRTKTIYNHIKHNKKHKEIGKADCIKAIDMLREQCRIYKNETIEYFNSEEKRID